MSALRGKWRIVMIGVLRYRNLKIEYLMLILNETLLIWDLLTTHHSRLTIFKKAIP